MAIETDTDLAIYFDPRDFGEEVLYTPRDPGSATYTVVGIFDNASTVFHPQQWPGGHQAAMQETPRFSGSQPTFECRSIDLVGGGRAKDRLTIGGVEYRVVEPKPDGTGVVILILNKVGKTAEA